MCRYLKKYGDRTYRTNQFSLGNYKEYLNMKHPVSLYGFFLVLRFNYNFYKLNNTQIKLKIYCTFNYIFIVSALLILWVTIIYYNSRDPGFLEHR